MPEWTPPNLRYPPPKVGEPPLHAAARLGDHAGLQRLVAAGGDLATVFNMGLDPGAYTMSATPLMVAAGSGGGASADTVQLLLDLGADPRQIEGKKTAAMFAVHGLGWNYRPGGDAGRLKLLLDAGSPLIFEGERNRRLVAQAAESGDPQRLGVVLDHGGSPNAVWDPESALRRAETRAVAWQARMHEHKKKMVQDHPELAGVLKDMGESDERRKKYIDAFSSGPFSFEIPLHGAAAGGNAECVRVLVKAGADVKRVDNSGATALFKAQSAAAVKALVEAGVPLDVRTRYADDALAEVLHVHFEHESRRREVADALIDSGLKLVVGGDGHGNRLYDAAFGQSFSAVEYLLKKGHPARPAEGCRTALHAVAWNYAPRKLQEHGETQLKIVRALVDAGASTNARDEHGMTPLFDAVAGDGLNPILARELVALAADVNARNKDELTPLAFLYDSAFDYDKAVPLLLELGANPLIPANDGRTALDRAEAMARGEEPPWRDEYKRRLPEDHPARLTRWKPPAVEGDKEWNNLQLVRQAADKFRRA